MDFRWQDSQTELHQAMAAFATQTLGETLAVRDVWRRCGAGGILGLFVPQRFGGSGHDALTTAFALEGFGYGCRDNGLNFALGAHLFGCTLPILAFGTTQQQEAWLPHLCSGEWVGALAMSEKDAGSDAFATRCSAEKQPKGYLLNGQKIYVTNGSLADLLIVVANIDPERGKNGLTAFVVKGDARGLSKSEPVQKMGLDTAMMSAITLADCFVSTAQRLGAEGSGVALFTHAMQWERGLILATAVGAMQRQLEACVKYVQQRRQFDRPIGHFQSVSNRIVTMRQRLEQARLMLYKMAWLLDQEAFALDMAALTKLTISEAWIANSEDAQQIHGGYGYLAEAQVERDLRDALGSRFYSGTSDIQRQLVAQWMRVSA